MAVVTGASSGIGLAIARYLLQSGCFVFILSRDRGRFEKSLANLRAISNAVDGFCYDLTERNKHIEFLSHVKKKYNAIDYLINNAGIACRKLPQDTQDEEWDVLMEINLNSVFRICRTFFPLLKKDKAYSKIINIGSLTSLLGARLGVAYSASKGAMIQLTKSLAAAWAKDRILVNAILPGWIKTSLTATGRADYPEVYSKIDSRILMGHWGEPEDIAKLTLLLLSDFNNYMTGSTIIADGGFSASID